METGSIIYIYFAHFICCHIYLTWCSYMYISLLSWIWTQGFDMPGCTCITGYLHMNIQVAVLIGTLKALSSDLCWCSWKILYPGPRCGWHYAWWIYWCVFLEGWESQVVLVLILNALIWAEYDGKGHRTDLIVDDGCDINLLIHEGNKGEGFFLKDVTIPDPIFTDNDEFNIVQTIIKRQI